MFIHCSGVYLSRELGWIRELSRAAVSHRTLTFPTYNHVRTSSYGAIMTHASVPADERKTLGITDSLVSSLLALSYSQITMCLYSME